MATTTRVLTASVNGTVYTSNANGALEAIDTCHSGATAPTNEVANGKFWLDTSTTPAILKIRNNGVWEQIGGSTSSPTFKSLDVNGGDANTPISVISTDPLALIGFEDGTTTDQVLMGALGDDAVFRTGAAERMRIDSSGNVGIGTNSPASKLDVTGSITASGNIIASGTSSTTKNILQTTSGQIEVRAGNTVSFLDMDFPEVSASAVSLRFFRNSNTTGAKTVRFHRGDGSATEDARISVGAENSFFGIGGGNVGIGTNNPQVELDVLGDNLIGRYYSTTSTTAYIRFDNTSSTNPYIGTLNGIGTFGNSDANPIRFNTNSAERMRIDSSGNVGIGLTNPSEALTVNGNVLTTGSGSQFIAASTGSAENNPSFTFSGQQASTGMFLPSNATLAFSTAGAERVRITSAGNVGIGTNSPSAKLDVSGQIKCTSLEVGGVAVGSTSLNVVGCYALCRVNNSNDNTVRAAGSTIAGSALNWANAAGNAATGVPSGTWRLMGAIPIATTSDEANTSVFLRIA